MFHELVKKYICVSKNECFIENRRVIILTGHNASGKSVYLKQVNHQHFNWQTYILNVSSIKKGRIDCFPRTFGVLCSGRIGCYTLAAFNSYQNSGTRATV